MRLKSDGPATIHIMPKYTFHSALAYDVFTSSFLHENGPAYTCRIYRWNRHEKLRLLYVMVTRLKHKRRNWSKKGKMIRNRLHHFFPSTFENQLY